MTTLTTGRNADRTDGRCAAFAAGLRAARRPRRSSALTLLELILVMVIICTVLAMAAPSLRGFFASRQTRDAAAQIVALTQYARAQAVAEGCVYRLHVDVADGRYWLTAQRGGVFSELGSEFGRVFHLPDGAGAAWINSSAAADNGWVPFYPDGRTEAVELELTGRQGEVVRIKCLSPAEEFHVEIPAEAERS